MKAVGFLALVLVVLVLVITYQKLLREPEITDYTTLRRTLEASRQIDEEVVLGNKGRYFRPVTNLNYTGNLPPIYLKDKPKKPADFNKTCAKFPDFFSLAFRNDLWQLQKTTNGNLLLFNAYLDTRNGSFVRIVSSYDVYRPEEKFYCQFWYDDGSKPDIVKSGVPVWIFSPKWGADKGYFYHPYLISCPLVSKNKKIPVSVSLVEKFCDKATNNLNIFHKNETIKKKFVVCIKGLSFPNDDQSLRLIEWIELLNLLGAEKINFYEFSVHPNAQKVLDYYVDLGLVEITPITLVGDYSNHPQFQNLFLQKKIVARRLQEVIPYNDCLYKHLDQFKYVVLLDTDEVIVPGEKTWVELIENLEKQFPDVNSYLARNVYFMDTHLHQHDWFDDIPKNMHMLQHVYRSKNFTKPGSFVKGFHNTQKVFTLHNHFPFKCLKSCKNKEMDVALGQLQHYRQDCASGVGDCQSFKENSILDTRVWQYKDELMRRMRKTCEQLNFELN